MQLKFAFYFYFISIIKIDAGVAFNITGIFFVEIPVKNPAHYEEAWPGTLRSLCRRE